MNGYDWRWKISEVVERLRTRYIYVGRKHGAPFLAVVYEPEAQSAVFVEWANQKKALAPDIDVRTVDILAVTQGVVDNFGAANVVEAMKNPMPGSDAALELSSLWIDAISKAVKCAFNDSTSSKPVVSLERLAALYPPIGPRHLMQSLWDSPDEVVGGPVIVLIPGTLTGEPRTYDFLGLKKEIMYRGDLL